MHKFVTWYACNRKLVEPLGQLSLSCSWWWDKNSGHMKMFNETFFQTWFPACTDLLADGLPQDAITLIGHHRKKASICDMTVAVTRALMVHTSRGWAIQDKQVRRPKRRVYIYLGLCPLSLWVVCGLSRPMNSLVYVRGETGEWVTSYHNASSYSYNAVTQFPC